MRELWANKLTAFTFQYQRQVKPYKDLLADFAAMLDRRPGMAVMDVGCGSGRVLELMLDDLDLAPSAVTAMDLSPFAIEYARRNVLRLNPACPVEFHQRDLSAPDCFASWSDNSFDLVTAGLCIQYAQHWDEEGQRWTTKAYERVLGEIARILKPGGQFLFSVDTPDPNFLVLARESGGEIFEKWWKAPYMLLIAGLLLLQGRELAREARKGRYHYLPIERVAAFLEQVGFRDVAWKLSFADLAWVISCRKPAAAAGLDAEPAEQRAAEPAAESV